ncbi:MAG: inositol monophosphatase [Planctomycetota bacterium]|nr:inositol monophosphatase [Planctomycetota bacterium]
MEDGSKGVSREHTGVNDAAKVLEVAIKAARDAGDVLRSWSHRFTVSEKGPADLVTEADLAAQSAIVSIVTSAFPDHDLLGEEDLTVRHGKSGFRWIIDPLDGTSNYVHGFPYFGVSIGVEFDGRPLAGVIFDPNRDELFTATAGGGAKLNDAPIRPSRASHLSDAFLVASLPRRAAPGDDAVKRFLKAMPVAESVQRTGSAALNLAYVACGRIDAFWSSSLKPWDMAAGVLLVTEAGGTVTSLNGGRFELERPEVLAANGTDLQQAVVGLLDTTE